MKRKVEKEFNFRKFLKNLNLNNKPGIYQMLDEDDQVLYIGKAINLKKRVLSYSKVTNIRMLQMMRTVRKIKVIETKNEAEALLLEAILIKKIQPFYNILLKDDKSFPYVVITNHKFPRLMTSCVTSEKEEDKYLMRFGPFLNLITLRRMIQALQKAFLIRSCTDFEFENRKRPCILYEINKCSAPCVGKIEDKSYKKLVKQVEEVFQWKSQKIISMLKRDILKANKIDSHELAKLYRDRLKATEQVLIEQKDLKKFLEKKNNSEKKTV